MQTLILAIATRRVLMWTAVLVGFQMSPVSYLYGVEVLDQQSIIDSSIGDSGSGAQEIGQTFTVGMSGTLTRIEVYLARVGIEPFDNALFTLYDTTSGLANSVMGNAVVNSSQISTTAPTFVSFDVSSFDIAVETNEVLAFAIKSSGSELYIIPSVDVNPLYAGGSYVRRTLSVPPGPWTSLNRDHGFKTYVDVEEPIDLPDDYNGNDSSTRPTTRCGATR